MPNIFQRLYERFSGRSVLESPPLSGALTIDSSAVVNARKLRNGQLAPLSTGRAHWYPADLDDAERMADMGDLSLAARIMKSARRDGVYVGVLSTRTSGLVRLRKIFRGNPEIIAELELGERNKAAPRSMFDDVAPPSELAKLAADGVELGIGVGELVKVAWRPYPLFVRLDPEFLQFRANENRWYYNSITGPIPITPGDGRWVLHMPGGRNQPWQWGIWRAIARAVINKDICLNYKSNYEGVLANPARIAYHPQGSSEEQQQGWFEQLAAWGVNSVFSIDNGYKAELLESNGIGWKIFSTTIQECNQEIIITTCGQTVTTDGGAGFQNSDIHKSIRSDLIQETADSLAFTINTQILPVTIATVWGYEALDRGAVVMYDVTPAKDQNAAASTLISVASAIKALTEALAVSGRVLDVASLCATYGVPIMGDNDGDGTPDDGLEEPSAVDPEADTEESEESDDDIDYADAAE